jgi:polyphosphate kinase
MNRNLFRRIEVAFPVRDPALKKRVINEGLRPYLKDNMDAWELTGDGKYHRRKARGKQGAFSAQQELAEALGAGAAQATNVLER